MRDVLFLVALPASGKSEIRRHLDHLTEPQASELGLGRLIHLDDYPYVHLLRRISEEAAARGQPGVVFPSADQPFGDPREWTVLTRLLDEDVRSVLDGSAPAPSVMDRMDRIRAEVGLGPMLGPERSAVIEAVAAEATAIDDALADAVTTWEPGTSTVIVEFARGGPEGADLPLDPPYGNHHALATFAPTVLERAAVLAVWVEPHDSRRRNRERARPGPDGEASILHHGVPEAVMRGEYGTDDLGWLLERARRPHTIDVRTAEGLRVVPAARVDNRDDLTSHLRGDPDSWDPDLRGELHRRILEAVEAIRTAAAETPRYEYRTALPITVDDLPGVAGVEYRCPLPDDAEALARLMMDAYRGTVDFDDETIDDARAEVAGYLATDPMLGASQSAYLDADLVATCLVSRVEGEPLIGYVMTAAAHKGKGLARAVVARSLARLSDAGEARVSAWITHGNVPSERVFARLGFDRV